MTGLLRRNTDKYEGQNCRLNRVSVNFREGSRKPLATLVWAWLCLNYIKPHFFFFFFVILDILRLILALDF